MGSVTVRAVSRIRLSCFVVGVVFVALLAACGSEKEPSAADGPISTPPSMDPQLVTIRPIVARSPAPCDLPSGTVEMVLPDPAEPAMCIGLGPAGFDASGVARARLSAGSGGGAEVDLELNDSGQAGFTHLASGHIGDRLAIVVGNRAVSTPTVQTPSGERIRIVGLSSDEATELVRAFGGDTTPPATSLT